MYDAGMRTLYQSIIMHVYCVHNIYAESEIQFKLVWEKISLLNLEGGQRV